MDWLTPNIAVGASSDVPLAIAEKSCDWIVNVAQEISEDSVIPHNCTYLKCGGVIAAQPILPLVLVLKLLIHIKKKILIHCSGGFNRSPAVAICLLIELGMNEQTARTLVSEKRQGSAPTETIIADYKREVGHT